MTKTAEGAGETAAAIARERDLGHRKEMAEVERRTVAELDAYLLASGLDDHELTDEEKEALRLLLQETHLTKGALRKLIVGMGV